MPMDIHGLSGGLLPGLSFHLRFAVSDDVPPESAVNRISGSALSGDGVAMVLL